MSVTARFTKKLSNMTLDISFEAGGGKIALIGESGSGKSMTLKCIAGIETPDEGIIEIDGETVFDSSRKINLPPRLRGCGYLFQSYALFPRLSARKNIELALSCSPAETRNISDDLLRRFGLWDVRDRKPSFMSGGQQQRLALARMLAPSPRVLFLDEPFSALDRVVKERVEEELRESLSAFPGTVVLVTHDKDEAYRFCDAMIVVHAGTVAEQGGRDALFGGCATAQCARLTGCFNISRAMRAGEKRIAVPDWGLLLETSSPVPDGDFFAGVRPHSIRERTRGDLSNCQVFERLSRVESPHSVSERLVSCTPPGYAGGDRGTRIPLIREYGVSARPKAGEADGTQTVLHIPPESVLILK
mgnify:CR=1 FL=1